MQIKIGDEVRRTGRTTRLVEYAITQARLGSVIYIVAANLHNAKHIERMLDDRLTAEEISRNRIGIKVESPQSLGAWSWERMTSMGAHPRCIFLVDHHAIEHHLALALRQLAFWNEGAKSDKVEPPKPPTWTFDEVLKESCDLCRLGHAPFMCEAHNRYVHFVEGESIPCGASTFRMRRDRETTQTGFIVTESAKWKETNKQ